jgi:hypothetical protein
MTQPIPEEPIVDNETWWQKVRKFEPARVRYVIGGLVLIAGLWGLNATELGDQLSQTWDIAYGILVLIFTGETIRSKVSPTETVVAQEKPTGEVVAGPAANVGEGRPVDVWPVAGGRAA